MATNGELESDVREELAWDPRVDAREIVVGADHGRITLSGSVSSEAARAAAAAAAARVLGVRSIENHLLVMDPFEQQQHGPRVPPATSDKRRVTDVLRYAASA